MSGGNLIAALLLAAAGPVQAGTQPTTPTPASVRVNPGAVALFERDWVLMNWALKFHDVNRDILLEPDEAQRAADAFRTLADTSHDGRVTPEEYRQAREFLLARY